MNKTAWIGVVAGIGIAAGGGVAGYSFLGKQAGERTSADAGGQQECWDEQLATVADPTDRHRIAGTGVGGAVGKDVGDRDITTAVGAAAGALIGRKIQEEVQDNRAGRRTVTTTERRCAPIAAR
jgi:uncharacterized protein YcfJ